MFETAACSVSTVWNMERMRISQITAVEYWQYNLRISCINRGILHKISVQGARTRKRSTRLPNTKPKYPCIFDPLFHIWPHHLPLCRAPRHEDVLKNCGIFQCFLTSALNRSGYSAWSLVRFTPGQPLDKRIFNKVKINFIICILLCILQRHNRKT
jgi:hypothetical protein